MSPTKPQTQRPLHSVETEKGVVSLASNKSVKLMIHIQPSGGPDMIRNWLLASDWWVCGHSAEVVPTELAIILLFLCTVKAHKWGLRPLSPCNQTASDPNS